MACTHLDATYLLQALPADTSVVVELGLRLGLGLEVKATSKSKVSKKTPSAAIPFSFALDASEMSRNPFKGFLTQAPMQEASQDGQQAKMAPSRTHKDEEEGRVSGDDG